MLLDKQISPDQIKMHASKQIEKQKKFLGTVRVHPGQTLWELNVDNGDIRPAIVNQSAIALDGKIVRQLVEKENCLYVVAVNVKNAKKKFRKQVQNLLK